MGAACALTGSFGYQQRSASALACLGPQAPPKKLQRQPPQAPMMRMKLDFARILDKFDKRP
jgi:hypothetical protein